MSVFGPQAGGLLALMCALPVWTFSTASSLIMLAAKQMAKGARTIAAPCIRLSGSGAGLNMTGVQKTAGSIDGARPAYEL